MKAIKEFRQLPEFEKDLKKLAKRFRTLEDDLRIFKEKELRLYHELGIDNQGIFPIPALGAPPQRYSRPRNLPAEH